jgi:hypothetical protein
MRKVLRCKWEEEIISNNWKFNRRLKVDRMSKEKYKNFGVIQIYPQIQNCHVRCEEVDYDA